VPRPLRVRNGLGGTGSPCLASCPDDRRPTVVGHARLAQAPPCGRYLPRYAVVDCACVVAAHKARLLPSGIQFAAISTPPLKRPRFTKISASFSLSPKCSSRSSLKRRRLRSSTADPGSDACPCRSAAGSACCWQPSAGGGPPSAWPANPAVAGPAERKAPACQPVRLARRRRIQQRSAAPG